MKAMLEFSGFLALALGAHLLVWNGSASGTAGVSGGVADSALAIAGADPALQAMVALWDSPPEVAIETPPLAPPPAIRTAEPQRAPDATRRPPPRLNTPTLSLPAAEQPLAADTPPPPPPPKPKAKASEPAPPKVAKKAPAQTSASGERLKGQGGAQAGQSRREQKPVAKADPSQMARWGGDIRRSIERQKRYPSSGRSKGAVSMVITVATNGSLSGLAVARSSGDAALDRAALDAVKRARLPKAPANIPSGSHRFTLLISFAR